MLGPRTYPAQAGQRLQHSQRLEVQRQRWVVEEEQCGHQPVPGAASALNTCKHIEKAGPGRLGGNAHDAAGERSLDDAEALHEAVKARKQIRSVRGFEPARFSTTAQPWEGARCVHADRGSLSAKKGTASEMSRRRASTGRAVRRA